MARLQIHNSPIQGVPNGSRAGFQLTLYHRRRWRWWYFQRENNSDIHLSLPPGATSKVTVRKPCSSTNSVTDIFYQSLVPLSLNQTVDYLLCQPSSALFIVSCCCMFNECWLSFLIVFIWRLLSLASDRYSSMLDDQSTLKISSKKPRISCL